MADPLSQYLLSSSERHASISPETLERLGKEAANMYLDKGISLNEAVVKLASSFDDINAEQIKRVVEFANTSTYLALHDKSKTAGAGSSYPQFELADANRIVGDLSDGARPTTVTRTDADYGRQPEKPKLSAARTDSLFAQAFGVEKTAKIELSKEAAVEDILQTKHSLQDLKAHLTHSGEQFDLMLKEAQTEYYDTIKRYMLEGNSLADVLAAARSTGVDQEKIAEVLKPVVETLIKEKVASPKTLKTQALGLSKVASRVVNERHPLVNLFGSVVSLTGECEKVAMSLEEIEEQLAKVHLFIQENFSAGSKTR
jgi:hypothetical protein